MPDGDSRSSPPVQIKRPIVYVFWSPTSPRARGHGFSQALINRAKQATRELGFETMIAPVRPTLKHESPELAMEEYISRRAENGEVYDPWIGAHMKLGGRVVNVCSESVRIEATLAKWRQWTGLPLTGSDEMLLPQGLAPLKVDMNRGVGIYREPNVWVRYDGLSR